MGFSLIFLKQDKKSRIRRRQAYGKTFIIIKIHTNKNNKSAFLRTFWSSFKNTDDALSPINIGFVSGHISAVSPLNYAQIH